MGMDLYLYKINAIEPLNEPQYDNDILEDQATRFMRNGYPKELFEPTYQLKNEVKTQLIAGHGKFTDWDYSIIGDPEHSWVQCEDGFLYEVTEHDITHIDEETNQKLFNFKSHSTENCQICYDRKPFRQYCEDSESNTITIGNTTGISDEDSKYIYDTLTQYNGTFFHEDNDVYKTLTKFFNSSVPGKFRNPIESGHMVHFCY